MHPNTAVDFPPELLEDIFLKTLPSRSQLEWRRSSEPGSVLAGHGDAPPRGYASPLLYHTPVTISSVCRRWEEIAMSLPQLWSFIVVDLDRREAMPRTLDAIAASLQRSKNAPLTFACISKAPHSIEDLDFQVFHVLFSVLDRIKHLFLYLDYRQAEIADIPEMYFQLQSSVPPSAPILESLAVFFGDLSPAIVESRARPQFLAALSDAIEDMVTSSPVLRTIDADWIDEVQTSPPVWKFPRMLIDLHSASKVHVRALRIDHAIVLLSSCPHVVDLNLDITSDNWQFEDSPLLSSPSLLDSVASLPQLERLQITCLNFGIVGFLLKHITSPSLKRWVIRTCNPFPHTALFRETCSSFLSRSACNLTELAIILINIPDAGGPPDPEEEMPFSSEVHDHLESIKHLHLQGLTTPATIGVLALSPNVEQAELSPAGVRMDVAQGGVGAAVTTPDSIAEAPIHLTHLHTFSLMLTKIPESSPFSHVTGLGRFFSRFRAGPQMMHLTFDTHCRKWRHDLEPWPASEFASFISSSSVDSLNMSCYSSSTSLDILRSGDFARTLKVLCLQGLDTFALSPELVEFLTISPPEAAHNEVDADTGEVAGASAADVGVLKVPRAYLLGDEATVRAEGCNYCQPLETDNLPELRNLSLLHIASWPRGKLADMVESRLRYSAFLPLIFYINPTSNNEQDNEGQKTLEDDDVARLEKLSRSDFKEGCYVHLINGIHEGIDHMSMLKTVLLQHRSLRRLSA